MPMFNTGNSQWDQGLNTLASGLFPDPSKVAQAGYYGAEMRNAQIGAAQKMDQMAALHRFGMMAGGDVNPGAPTYAPAPGPNMPMVMRDPYASGSQPPASTPPLSATVAPAPAAAPAAAAAPAPVAAAPAPVPTAAPVPSATPAPVAPASTTAAPPAGPAPTLVDALTTGTPPATSPDAPGTPSSSNATGSNGTVPTGDHSAGLLHPGSITTPDGGVKTSGPAAPDGSPARPAVTLAQYVAAAVMGGMDANQARLQGSAMLATLYQRGIIDRDTYHQMLGGAGEPSMGVADTQAASAARVAGIQAASAANVANITQTGETTRTGMPLQDIVDPNNPTQITRVPLAQLQGPGGVRSYNPNAVSTAVAPVTTQAGPNAPVLSTPTFQAQKDKTPLYQPTTLGAVGTYIDPKNPTQLLPRTFEQAQQLGLVEAPKTMEGWTALAASASANEPDPAKAQAIRDKVMAFATAAAPKPTDANESVRNSNIIDRQLQAQMPVPTIPLSQGGGMNTNTLPAGSSPETAVTLQNLTDQYFTRSPDPSIRGNRVAAANAAIQQLIKQGYIDPNQSRAGSLAPGSITATTIQKPVFNKNGTIEQVPHFRVDIKDPKTGKVYGAGQAPTVPMATAPPSLSSTVAGSNTPPAGALGPAPEGAADGTTGTTSTGQRGVVRGGWVYPAS